MAPVMKYSLSSSFEALDFFILESCSGVPILVFIGYKTGDQPEYFVFCQHE